MHHLTPRATGTPGCSRTPSAAATARATCPASRVLPTPPGPVTVTSRCSASRSATSRTGRGYPHARTITAGAATVQPDRTGRDATPGEILITGSRPVGHPTPALEQQRCLRTRPHARAQSRTGDR